MEVLEVLKRTEFLFVLYSRRVLVHGKLKGRDVGLGIYWPRTLNPLDLP